jgi:hypothetical protein
MPLTRSGCRCFDQRIASGPVAIGRRPQGRLIDIEDVARNGAVPHVSCSIECARSTEPLTLDDIDPLEHVVIAL